MCVWLTGRWWIVGSSWSSKGTNSREMCKWKLIIVVHTMQIVFVVVLYSWELAMWPQEMKSDILFLVAVEYVVQEL